jgi:hypothetical protein
MVDARHRVTPNLFQGPASSREAVRPWMLNQVQHDGLRLLIANRGEIACRIVRTAHTLAPILNAPIPERAQSGALGM